MMFKRDEPVEFHKLSLFRVNILYMHIYIWHIKNFGIVKGYVLERGFFIWSCSSYIKRRAVLYENI